MVGCHGSCMICVHIEQKKEKVIGLLIIASTLEFLPRQGRAVLVNGNYR